MMNARTLVLGLLVATFFLPLFSIPVANSQSTSATTTMTISQPASQGQCSTITIGFTARAGQLISGTFGSDASIDFYILSQNDLNSFQDCTLLASVRPIYVEENIVGYGNPYQSLPFPTNGTYYFVFEYVRGSTELTSGYATVKLTFPLSIAIIGATASVSLPTTSMIVSSSSAIISATSATLTFSTASAAPSSSIVVSTASQPTQSTSAMSESVPASSLSILGMSATSLLIVIVCVVVAAGGLTYATLFRNRKRHTLSSYLAKIDSTYNQFAVDREECRTRLEQIKGDIIDMLNKRQIDEGHFLMLDEKISDYQKQLAQATPKYKRSSTSEGSSGAGNVSSAGQAPSQVKYCRNCGAKLSSDEKVCKKCGTTQ
jgi:ribosomal protein L40E